MTQNQIKYQELEEARYHNRIMEQETKRSNLANEEIKQQSNVINAQHYMYSDAETERANRAREMENSQHNRTTEAIQWYTAGSEARLRESNMQLNSVYADKAVEETLATKDERMLTQAKTQTEEDYYRPYLWSQKSNYESQSKLNEAKTKTEGYTALKELTTAGLNDMELEWYGTNKRNQVLMWAGNQVTDLLKSAVSFGGSYLGAQSKLQGDLLRNGYYSPSYNYNIQ